MFVRSIVLDYDHFTASKTTRAGLAQDLKWYLLGYEHSQGHKTIMIATCAGIGTRFTESKPTKAGLTQDQKLVSLGQVPSQ